jgi:hypothetical protein
MKARPILMSAPMVQATLREIEQEGTGKTQTRRTIKPQPVSSITEIRKIEICDNKKIVETKFELLRYCGFGRDPYSHEGFMKCPYGTVGDVLWVRETIQHPGYEGAKHFVYSADGKSGNHEYYWKKKHVIPSIYMSRWASRITLEITDIRVERLQDISQKDAISEGAPLSHPSIDAVSRDFGYEDFSRSWYAQLWEFINGKGSWDANPWVWVISFKPILKNIDEVLNEQR